MADPEAALLLDGTDGLGNPQTGPRVTLTGIAERIAEPRLLERFLAIHPGAALYAGFADFAIWRLRPERAHFVGGFGRAVWFDAPLVPEAAAMAAAEPALLAEFADGALRLVGVDADGCDHRTADGLRRASFPQPADGLEAARSLLAGLALTPAPGSTQPG